MLMTHKYFPESEFYHIFDRRFNEDDIKINYNDQVWDTYRSLALDKNLIIDVLVHERDFLFGTIGCIKNIDRMRRLRNVKSLTRDEFKLEANTVMEDYTFFLLDYNTGVVSVINSKSAPSIKQIVKILHYYAQYDPRIYPIKNHDVPGELKKVTEVGSVSLKFAVPPTKVLGTKTQISILNEFSKNGYDSCEVIFHLDRRNKNRKQPYNIIDQVRKTYDLVKNSDNEFNLEHIKLVATAEEERQQTINLFELYFTKGVQINIDENFTEKDILKSLQLVYNDLKPEIMNNIRLHS